MPRWHNYLQFFVLIFIDYYTELPVLKGSKSVTLTAHLQPTKGADNSAFLLPSSNQKFETPLDIVINLMVSLLD